MRKVLFMLIATYVFAYAETDSFNKIILEHQIDVESKSLKSWIRIFNSQESAKEYGFQVSETQRYTILKGLKSMQNKSENKYARRLR
jgi:hypothetical protein